MDENDFCKEQYLTLREEIRETKNRIFYIGAIALFVAPAGQFIVRAMDAQFVVLLLPLLVMSVALLYLSENHALMRCGRFIKHHVEPRYPTVDGWENWLETPDPSQPRSVDRLAAYAIYLVLGCYYVATTVAAEKFCLTEYGVEKAHLALGLYAGCGIVAVAFLLKNIRSSTATLADIKSVSKAVRSNQP